MPEQSKFIGQLAVLFLVSAILLLLMDRQMLIGPEELAQWPFALLSLVVLGALWLHQSSLLKSCRLRHTFILPFSLFIIIFNRRHNYESWRYWRWHYGPGYC